MTNSESCEHRRWTVSANDTVGNGTCLDCHQSVPLYFLFQGLRERMEAALAALTPPSQYAGVGGGGGRGGGGGGGGMVRFDNDGRTQYDVSACRAPICDVKLHPDSTIECMTCGSITKEFEPLRCLYSGNIFLKPRDIPG